MRNEVRGNSQANQRHNKEVPRNRQPPNRPTPPSKVIRPRFILRVILIQTSPQHRKDIRNLPSERAPREESFESGVRANRDGTECGGDDEDDEGGVVGCVGAFVDGGEPVGEWEGFVAGVGEEDSGGCDELRCDSSYEN